jgi:hypothetical protein
MPLTLTLTEGVLPAGQETTAFVRLGQAMLEAHGLAGNETMRRNLVGSLHVLPAGQTFIGGEPAPVVFVEWKVPAFAFAEPEVQTRYFRAASDIIETLSGGSHPRDRTFINVVHTVDGAWNFDGTRMTNAEIGERIARG